MFFNEKQKDMSTSFDNPHRVWINFSLFDFYNATYPCIRQNLIFHKAARNAGAVDKGGRSNSLGRTAFPAAHAAASSGVRITAKR
jgi:hypothetical protein